MDSQIKRREFLKAAGWGLAGVGLAAIAEPARAVTRKKFNVLFVGYDDLRVQLSTYGYEQMKTPNFERLARMGLQFNRAYIQQAVCAPSRASFLTGCRPDTTGVDFPYTPWFETEFLAKHRDIGTYFKDNGYYTRYLGKVHHGRFTTPQTEPLYQAAPGGIPGRKYAFPAGEGHYTRWRDKVPPWEAGDVPDTEYEDGLIAEEAIRTMERAVKAGKPFFVSPGFYKPHLPLCCPKKYWDLYRPEDIRFPEVTDLSPNQPTIAMSRNSGLWRHKGFPTPEYTEDQLRTLIHAYYACTSFADAQLGKLLDALERMNLMNSTIILVWSDHGYHTGHHGSWGKWTNFECATHSPLYIYVPGMKCAAKQTDALVEYVDMYPTLTGLCGLRTPDYVEGTSFAALLDDPQRPWKKAAFSQFPRPQDREGYSMRTARYRYIEWRDKKTGKPVARELYDHQSDPHEADNIVDRPENRQIVEELAKALKEGWEKALPPGYTNSSNNPPGDDSWYRTRRKGKTGAKSKR
jgi:iduronate 2-sulfatase